MKPLDFPVIATAHDPMHVQHKYWSRKPINVIKAHIEAVTSPGDIILDPFCGSGPVVSQAVISGRRVVGTDLNPVALFITKNTIRRIDLDLIDDAFNTIKKKVESSITGLYKTRCIHCLSTDTHTICIHWKVHHPIKIWYTCDQCSSAGKKRGNRLKKFRKRPDSEDLTLLDVINDKAINAWYPNEQIPEGMVFNQARRGAKTFGELFTKRNLMALALLRDTIEQLPEGTDTEKLVKQLFLFSFTSMVHLCSKMTPIRPSRPYSSFWATNSYWLPPKFMESNVWEKFESAILGPQGLIASRRDANKKIPKDLVLVSSFEELKNAGSKAAFLRQFDATNISELLPQESIDYILTDPPYAGSIPYLELSTLWATWLKLDTQMEFDKEVLIDEPRGKDVNYYSTKLSVFFKSAYKVLKPGKYMSFTYHNLDSEIRMEILRASISAGFELIQIIYQPPPRTSPAHTLRPFNSAIGDYIVHFQKPISDSASTSNSNHITCSEREIKEKIVNLITDFFLERGEPATYTILVNVMDVILSKEPWFLHENVDIKKILRDNEGTLFTRYEEHIGTKKGYSWGLSGKYLNQLVAERGISMPIPLSEKIKRFVTENKKKFKQISSHAFRQEILREFRGPLQPDLHELQRILEHIKQDP